MGLMNIILVLTFLRNEVIYLSIKIFIDTAHNPVGNPDSGQTIRGINESDIVYNVGHYLAGFLENDPRFEVRISRPEPDTVIGTDFITSRDQRVKMANEWPANFFIGLHTGVSEDPYENGSEAFVLQLLTVANWFATNILKEIAETVGTKDRGVQTSDFYTLKNTRMPSVIIVLGFLTNISDAKKLTEEQYQFAAGIYKGMENFFGFL